MNKVTRNILTVFLLTAYLHLSAQELVMQTDHQLQWKLPEKWISGNHSKQVLSFESATYPDESLMPSFTVRFKISELDSYHANIANAVYTPLSEEELALITIPLPTITEPQLKVSEVRGSSYLQIQLSPFVYTQGIAQKLKSFTLQVYKTPLAKKAKKSTRHSYAQNSVLANGRFVKIAVTQNGVHRLTFEDLQAMGITPANVRLFGYGGHVLSKDFSIPMLDDLPEVPIHMESGSDGVFNAGDYILFYANGTTKWSYDSTRELFVHAQNTYATKGYYFVSSDVGTGRKIETSVIPVPVGAPVVTVTEFTDYAVHERDITNLVLSGKEFYGEKFNPSNPSLNVAFNFPNTATTANSIKARLDVIASATSVSSYSLLLDNGQEKSLSVARRNTGDFYEKAKASNAIFSFTPSGDALNFRLQYQLPNANAEGYLNFLSINLRRKLIMHGSSMAFRNVDHLGSNNYLQYQIDRANMHVQIWDITESHQPFRVQTERNAEMRTFTAPGTELRQYLAIDPTQANTFPKPEIVGLVPNQNLHALPQAEFLIITHPLFETEANRLAQAHRTMDNMRVNVLRTDQIFNEFSSGTPDATAYRKAVKMFYDRAKTSGIVADLPKYLLLFGRGSFDNRKLISGADNYILTYQADNSLVETLSFVTDDYFGFLDDNEGNHIPSHLLDIGIGRFPVTTVADAKIVVDKNINYMRNTNGGKWKNQLCFVADDGDNALHMKQADSIANIVSRNFKSYQTTKIYLDAYLQETTASGDSYPVARKQMLDLLHKGLLYFNYTGHAGPQGWTDENILTVNDVNALTNKHLPVWVGATCNFLQFDAPTISAGEQVVLNPNGGGIAIFSAARPVYASQNFTVNRFFTENLFKKPNGKHYRMGDVVALAKNSIGSEINKLSYVYIGNPALQLNFPTEAEVITTSIKSSNNQNIDTLRAMAVVQVEAEIRRDGQKATNFNGTVWVDVFDKAQRNTTLNNDGDGSMTYTDRNKVLYSGKTSVVNGNVSFTFMMPKDIRYSYGGGRINYYALEQNNGIEGQGHFEQFSIGGTYPNVIYENDGPAIDLFLNSTQFVSGDKVNESPMLIANINDKSGINKVGSGIGHDITVVINNEPNSIRVLNDFFENNTNSFTEGYINYRLSNLSEGKHTLTLKAWDLLNNSSSKSIDFEVVKGLTPSIFRIYNYPNPVSTETRIVVEHNRPETLLKTTVEIFDLAGRKIWIFEQNNADEVRWDLRGIDGMKVKSGIYFYKVSISTSNSDVYSKTNKMLVIEK